MTSPCRVAEHIGGSVDGFVQKMNDRAAQLGCTNTVFTNPTGLPDENQHTTARDMALIMKAAIDNDTFRTIAGTTSYTIPATNVSGGERVLTNNFSMLNSANAAYYPNCLGGREGYTEASGSTLVCGAEKKRHYADRRSPSGSFRYNGGGSRFSSQLRFR